MNAISSIDAALPREPFEAVQEAASAWRGRCLDVFARSEAVVTETLLVLVSVDGRGSLKLPHLVGQRYDALSGSIGSGGAFAEEGKTAAEAVSRFRKHDAFRTQISHGVFTVTLDHRDQWHLVARVLALRTGRASRELFVTQQAEAAVIVESLEKDGSRMRTALGQPSTQLGWEAAIAATMISGHVFAGEKDRSVGLELASVVLALNCAVHAVL